MIDYRAARVSMVESQLRTNKVTDEALLEAFLAVPRERFVPRHLAGIAYVDEDLPLGHGRFLTEPMVLARLLQLAAILPTDRVLDIGAATGYAAALLSRLARSVVAVEAEPALVETAQAQLAALGCANVALVKAPLAAGHPAGAPYDVILIDGAVAVIDEAVARQLAPGGRLVTVLKGEGTVGQAVVMTEAGGVLSHWPVFDAATPVLPPFLAAPSFVF